MKMKKKHLIIGMSVIAIALLLIVTKGFGFFGQAASASLTGAATGYADSAANSALTADSSGDIKISASEISGNAKWYSYNSDGINVRFFAVKADDGTLRTAFDACDVCYRNKKGYHQEGNDMVCNNCGKHYPIGSIGAENKNPGGCWPGYLPSQTKEGFLVIKSADMGKGVWRFT